MLCLFFHVLLSAFLSLFDGFVIFDVRLCCFALPLITIRCFSFIFHRRMFTRFIRLSCRVNINGAVDYC